MTKVLVTGGSGFIATHIVEQLLAKGHSVVTTVRNEDKAAHIYAAHPELGKDRLQVEIVPELTQPDAFDKTVQIPGIEVVLHTASPFHFRVTDPVKDLVDPAVLGTTGILKSIKKHAPQVRRVVITSSFAAILSADWNKASTVYSETSWNPVTLEEARNDATTGYRASKTFAERAAREFVATETPNFDVVTVNPPMVFGPVVGHLDGLSSVNTSNERIVNALTGVWKKNGRIPDTGAAVIWVDVRDVAAAHIIAGVEKPEIPGGSRLFTTAGYFSNQEIFEILQKKFPEYVNCLPPPSTTGGEAAKEHFRYDNAATEKLLGIKWIPLEKSIVDTVKSLQEKLN